MHGIVFASLRDYVAAHAGADGARTVFGTTVYSVAEAYPDEEFAELAGRAAAVTGLAPEALQREFGAFAARTTFTRLFPAFFDIAGDSRTFLLTIEARIHELVRATIPNAVPPRLTVSPNGDDGVDVVYTSPRRLCALLEGLVAGTAAHYGERAELDETKCMRRGDGACVYRVRFAALSP